MNEGWMRPSQQTLQSNLSRENTVDKHSAHSATLAFQHVVCEHVTNHWLKQSPKTTEVAKDIDIKFIVVETNKNKERNTAYLKVQNFRVKRRILTGVNRSSSMEEEKLQRHMKRCILKALWDST